MISRRKFLISSLAGISGLGAGIGFYSCKIEPHWLELKRLQLPVKNLPQSLLGKTLMQISDIHVGHQVDSQYLLDSFAQAARLKPDIIVYTGDFISYITSRRLNRLVDILNEAPHGEMATFAILGNHDYGYQWSEADLGVKITERLFCAGIHVLRNEVIDVDGLRFVGLEDMWGPNFTNDNPIIKGKVQGEAITFCHNPDAVDLPIWDGYQGWVLSGHTHGGQCKPPFLPPPMLPVKNRRYTAGRFVIAPNRSLYINSGLGHIMQVRFNVRPEITLFTLVDA